MITYSYNNYINPHSAPKSLILRHFFTFSTKYVFKLLKKLSLNDCRLRYPHRFQNSRSLQAAPQIYEIFVLAFVTLLDKGPTTRPSARIPAATLLRIRRTDGQHISYSNRIRLWHWLQPSFSILPHWSAKSVGGAHSRGVWSLYMSLLVLALSLDADAGCEEFRRTQLPVAAAAVPSPAASL